ncbi:MAG: quinohemoprotein ethanol dehydrogenase, partial [Gaiellaceae bacterium]|nr:quinohemoprotein ethanol dehydrogenase [Gaiellaceae bacterium]
MTLVAGLIFVGGFVGWVLGHYAGSSATKTVTVAAGSTSPTSSEEIAKAPNFSAADLSALPKDGWPTVGGNLFNERYSPLDQIDTSNVSELKGVWRTHLNGSGVGAKYSAESQPVVYKGVIYVTTGEDDAFAVSVATGKILWSYTSGISQKITTVCCGWLNRGVAIGDGRVYLGQLDGKVVALDQQTGKPLWTKQLVKWQLGQTITAAPIYVDGKIYIGVVGAEFGTRSFLQAIDAATGKYLWRWYTTAGPGEPGGNTWPSGSKEYLRGGATIWQAPAVDEKLGLLYFSTGNAGSDWFGGDRRGKNLFAASIVALDLKTGKLKWYFQQVHHDIWDFDSASPVVLFDAGGKQGIAQASKTGWLYMLDRATGRPLYGIPEKPVPQNAAQKSWPTQPIPANGAFTPHGPVPEADVARVKKEAVGPLKKVPVVVAKVPFTPPPPGKLLIYGNGPQGGVNWQPVSYNEKTHMIYVCSAVSWVGFEAARTPFVKPGKSYTGVAGTAGVAWPEASGTFTAIDATSGKTMWQHRFPEPCYAGTATTAGNLVFVGRNAGQLQAYNAKTGAMLWSFQTGAGANNTSTIFQQDGKQYVAFLSGGNSLGATPHGDSLWLFGLDGTVGPAPAPGKGSGTQHEGEGGKKSAAGTKGDATAGGAVFANNCQSCHGADGRGGNGGPDLTSIPSAKNEKTVLAQVENGGGGMPAFKGQL